MKRKSQQAEERHQASHLPVAFAVWLVFEASDNETAASDVFRKKFGIPPEHIVDHKGYLWLGPVPEARHGLV